MSQSKCEREKFDKLDVNDEYTRSLIIENDPLSFEQKNKITDFAYSFFYATRRGVTGPVSFGKLSVAAPDIISVFKKIKPYHALTDEQIRGLAKAADALPYSPVSLGEHVSFELFYDVLSHPELHADLLGIEPTQSSQVYAAGILMEAVFDAGLYVVEPKSDNYVSTTSPYGNTFAQYRHVLCGEGSRHLQGSRQITAKHKLLMRRDPIRRIDMSNTSPSPLDFLLDRTHFLPGRWNTVTGMMTQRDQFGQEQYADKWVEYKEELRDLIGNELTNLYQHPDLHHVMAALGEILRESNKYLLFSGHTLSVGALGSIHKMGLGHQGFYDGGNAIVSAGIVDLNTLRVCKENVATVVHEALHLIFDTLIQNTSSPVATSRDEIKLDQAILADQEHRKKLDYAVLNDDEKAVWRTVVSDLENQKSYFTGLSNERKQHVMRVEIIVRPLERLAAGNREASIRKVMPHVWTFYREHCRPMIETYLHERGHQDLIVLKVPSSDLSCPEKKEVGLVPHVGSTKPVQIGVNSEKPPRHQPPEGNAQSKAPDPRQQALGAELALHRERFKSVLAKINELSREESDFQIDLAEYYRRLNHAQSTFFANPQGSAFDEFNDICQQESLELEAKLKSKASVWQERVSPLVKNILGCLLGIAATLISCGLFIVVMKTQPKIYQAYQNLFFKEPISNKIKQPIKELKEVIDTIDKEQEALRR